MKRKNRKKDEENFVPKAFKKNKKSNKINESTEIERKKFSFKKAIIFLFILIIIIGLISYIKSYTSWRSLAIDMITNTASQVIDLDGKVIETIGNEKIKKNVKLSDLPDNLKNAYVAIEDQRFYKHSGVDIKRTGAAVFTYVIHRGSSSFGGSTITQQLVKNLTGDSSSSITRKIKEWKKAFELETFLSKDEILEAYLNIIYVGPNIYGVASGSEYYFNKDISKLSLAECAFLAGINNAPNSYNPFGDTYNSEKISNRTKTVLNKMLELKYINEENYNKAVAEVDKGLKFKKGSLDPKSDGVYSYHTDALISEVVSDLADRKNISTIFATNYLEMAELKIYSTQHSDIQSTMETEFEKKTYILSSKTSDTTSQASMVIIDQSTGYVVGCVGGLGKKETARGLNRATQSVRQTGSAIKPLAVLGPALQKKIITPTTIYNDKLTTFDDATSEGYTPINYNKYLGEITVRRAVESSQNIPFVKMMEELTPEKSIKYLKKLGFSSLTEDDENLTLALGGLVNGASSLEMAAAYATIANGGKYIEPTFYTKIENSNGKTILKTKQKTRRVFSEATSFVLTKLLTQPVEGSNGTATYCALDGIEVAAKTGTTNDNYDRWLCEYTPYYTSVTWYGFDMNESINYNGKNPAGLLSARVMAKVHSKLADKSFTKPFGVNITSICSETGLVANNGCPDIYTEYFLFGTIPDKCTKHSSSSSNSQKNDTTTQNKTTKKKSINLNDENIFKDETDSSNTVNNTVNSKSDNITTNTHSNNTSNSITDTNSNNSSTSTTNSSEENILNDTNSTKNNTISSNSSTDTTSENNTSSSNNTTGNSFTNTSVDNELNDE